MKRFPPQEFEIRSPEPPLDDVLAREAAAVIAALTQCFTAWRRELGFDDRGAR